MFRITWFPIDGFSLCRRRIFYDKFKLALCYALFSPAGLWNFKLKNFQGLILLLLFEFYDQNYMRSAIVWSKKIWATSHKIQRWRRKIFWYFFGLSFLFSFLLHLFKLSVDWKRLFFNKKSRVEKWKSIKKD